MEQESVLPEALDEDLRALAVRVNGFLYHGDRLEALIDTVKVLRADHELAARLLGFQVRVELTYRPKGSGPHFEYITRGEVEDLKGSDLEIDLKARELWVSDWAEVPYGSDL